MTPSSRRTVGNWEIHDVIGSGSFAIVWKARSISTGTLAAVKEILADRLNKKLHESLESEIAVLQKLKHTNIVGLLDLYKEPGKIFLILEYCGGGDLAQHLRQRGPLSEASCRYLLRQLAEGLKVLRQHNVIHRDLKPQNLLLSDHGPSPTLKIADFGFARSLQPAGLAETLCGSPLYMAPEVLQLHRYDAKADLWSVGTILFELLTGKPPFSGSNHYQLVQNIERGDAVVPDHIARTLSPGCRQLLHQLLRRNPVERISFDEFFAHPFLVGEAASAAVTPLTGGVPCGASASPSPAVSSPVDTPGSRAVQVPGAAPGVVRRYTPVSQGAVRFVQPVRCGSPVHPAFQIPPSSSPTSKQHQQHQPTASGANSGQVQGDGHAGGNRAAADGTVVGTGTAAAGGGVGAGGPGGAGSHVAAPVPPAIINVRELTRSPSPRIAAAAAAVASALVEDDAQARTWQAPLAEAHKAAPSGSDAAAPPGPVSAFSAAAGAEGMASSVSISGSGSGCSRPLVDSLDSDYVVVSSPCAASRPAVPLSPRTPHPAMASGKVSRSCSLGGALPSLPVPPASGPAGEGKATSWKGDGDAAPAAAAGAAAAGAGAPPPVAAQPSWQQHLSPIAAATLPPSHGLPYSMTAAATALGAMGPSPVHPATELPGAAPNPSHLSAAAATSAAAALGPGPTMVTIRVPPPGACEGDTGDPMLLPRVVGVLLDHAKSRCSALLDADAEARQLGDTHAAIATAGGCEPGRIAAEATAAQLADEAAAAVGTLLVACRLLLAALASSAAVDGGPSPVDSQEKSGAAASLDGADGGPASGGPQPGHASASSVVPDGGSAMPGPALPPSQLQPPPQQQQQQGSTPAPGTLAALAGHARSVLTALDEHLHGTVAKLLVGAADAPSAAARSGGAAGHPACSPDVPCGLDALLSTAVHHSRAAAGEELLGNTVGAVEHYGRAADVLLFLLAAPQLPGPSQQSVTDGCGASPQLDAMRPPLTSHDRQRLTKYYAAVRLRQSAALATLGPAAAAAAAPHLHQHPHQQPLLHHPQIFGAYARVQHPLDRSPAPLYHQLDSRRIVSPHPHPHPHPHPQGLAGGLAHVPSTAVSVATAYGYERGKDCGAVTTF